MADEADACDDCSYTENVLLRIEAEAVVKEIAFAVDHVEISPNLQSSDECVYLNLRTKENIIFTVELTVLGFRVVGRKYDQIEESCFSRHFETIYGLLDHFSPEYRQSFGQALLSKLNQLQQERHLEANEENEK